MTSDPTIQSRSPNEPSVELDYALIGPDDAPSECVLFPATASGLDPQSHWIVAHGDAFVDLDATR